MRTLTDYALLTANALTLSIWAITITAGFKLGRSIGPIPHFWWYMLVAMGIWFVRGLGFVLSTLVDPNMFGPWDWLDNTVFPVADAALLGGAVLEMKRAFDRQLVGFRSLREAGYPIGDLSIAGSLSPRSEPSQVADGRPRTSV